MFENPKYIEIAIGSTVNRNQSIALEKLSSYVNGEELYRSYYTFNADFPKHLETFKTVKSFKGKCYLDRIILDIDKGGNTDQFVLDRMRECIRNMIDGLEIPEDWIQPWFSGTGYHIHLPNIFGFEPSKDLPQIVKETLVRYFPEADPSIYDRTRLIRVGWTKNNKTGLYKTPFTIQEIMNLKVAEIHDKSKEPFRKIEQKNAEYTQLFEPIIPVRRNNRDYGSTDTRQAMDITAVAPCVAKMYTEGPQIGKRHITILRMVSYYRRHGLPEAAVRSIIEGWVPEMESKERENIIASCYAGGYRYGCHDKVMDEYCDPKCIYYPSKAQGNDPLIAVLSATDMEKRYVERIRNNLHDQGFNLNEIYPSIGGDYWFLPNELSILMGDTGLGKTGLMQNIILKAKLQTLWLSLEFDDFLMYRRFLQIEKSKTAIEVDDHYQSNTNSWSKDISFIQCLTVPPTIEAIKHLVAEIQPKVLVIDTIDGVGSSQYISDSMVKTDHIINGLRQIVSQQNIMVIGVSHITKSGSRDGRLDVHAAKHSSSIAQKADKVMAIEGERDSQIRVFRSLKSRDAENFETTLEYNPLYFQFNEVNRGETRR
tara:strand:+ start:5920 stop:7704 length:1785 start_codon:yes stop_codon:yes gene_type:complete